MMNNSRSIIHRKYFGECALIFNTVIWGGTFVVVKNSLTDISPMLFVGIRFLIASLLLLPFALKELQKLERKSFIMGILVGILLFLGFSTQTVALNYTTATKSGFITGSLVMFTPLLQLIIDKRKPSFGAVFGSLLVLLGLVFLSVKDTSVLNLFNELGSNFNFGDVLTLLSAIFFAMQIVFLDKASRRVNFKALTFLQLSVTSALAFLLSVLLSGAGIEPMRASFTASLLGGLAYTAVLATFVTMTVQTRFQKEVSPTKAGIIYSFEPLFSALFAFFALGEGFTLFSFIGCFLIFSGLLSSELLEKAGSKSKAEMQVQDL
ncbi:MAG: DMT family transporter [Ignavibacteria bacterium]|jgi:drug/metabolite transporter (DMT)-like permease|nr:DMT family transporter [Ignavibacteria bacterium]MCU7504815.1 DMT family transporter [Ignavibacteria bacterium]MCU7517701.1 DMT family transporter [Ignavibacteria bacterium]